MKPMVNAFWRGVLFCLWAFLGMQGWGGTNTVQLGIDVLAAENFKPLNGKRVGLLTHPAGVNRQGMSSIDVLNEAKNIQLVALFGPEHGLRGNVEAAKDIANDQDRKTKLPIYSLYGKTRRPTKQMLEGIDVMVVDLQDVGCRSYTYVACMCYTMEECFKAGIDVVVLDRPNPIGGIMVDGPMRDETWKGYLAYLPIPYVHGLTIGELAKMALAEGWLDISWVQKKLAKLTVVPMRGWKREMTWDQTGLKWVPTSPNIPTAGAALGYAMTGLGAQLGGFKHGIGTPYPFRLLSYPGKTPEALKTALEAQNIPGIRFEIRNTQGSKGQKVQGLYVRVNSFAGLRPTQLSFYMMKLGAEWSATNPFAAATPEQAELFNKHTGSTALWEALVRKGSKIDLVLFFRDWRRLNEQFKDRSRQYWLY